MRSSEPMTLCTAASALRTHWPAKPAASVADTSAPTLPVAGSAPSTNGSWPAVKTRWPEIVAGTYAATGFATAGMLSPSSARRASMPLTSGALRPLEVGDEAALGARDDLHELPPLLAPVVEDGRRAVDQQRRGRVLP